MEHVLYDLLTDGFPEGCSKDAYEILRVIDGVESIDRFIGAIHQSDNTITFGGKGLGQWKEKRQEAYKIIVDWVVEHADKDEPQEE